MEFDRLSGNEALLAYTRLHHNFCESVHISAETLKES